VSRVRDTTFSGGERLYSLFRELSSWQTDGSYQWLRTFDPDRVYGFLNGLLEAGVSWEEFYVSCETIFPTFLKFYISELERRWRLENL